MEMGSQVDKLDTLWETSGRQPRRRSFRGHNFMAIQTVHARLL